ncbi:MAG: hypothetical protein JW850_01915 [Thermoflexales bacterium]|nr:hypothetical protein [Thermoflexales bacterium]
MTTCRSDSFVVRIWREREEEGAAWRGWVQHAVGIETRYFERLVDLWAFIEAYTGPLPDAAHSARASPPRRGV